MALRCMALRCMALRRMAWAWRSHLVSKEPCGRGARVRGAREGGRLSELVRVTRVGCVLERAVGIALGVAEEACMCSACAVHVQCMCSVCAYTPHAHRMHTACTPHAQYTPHGMLTVYGEDGRVEVQHAQPGEGEVEAGAVRVKRARGELGGRDALVAELLVRLPWRRERLRLRPRPHQDRRLL